MYIESDYDDPKKKKLHLDVPDEELFKDIAIGEEVTVVMTGTVCGLRAPRMERDYSVDVKPGQKRPLTRKPGTFDMEITQDAKVNKIVESSEVGALFDMMTAEESGATD